MAGSRGPIGKRSDERVRRNKPENEGRPAVVKGQGIYDFEIPKPPLDDNGDPAWHPTAILVYESFAASGQSYWAQRSDWALLYLVCEDISRELNPQFVGLADRWSREAQAIVSVPVKMKLAIKGASLGSILKALGSLGMTEGDRRRMNMELQRGSAQLSPEELAAQNVADIRAHASRGSKLDGITAIPG